MPSNVQRKKGPPSTLSISMPPKVNHNVVVADSSADSDLSPSHHKPRSLRNMKKLSLTLPSAASSTASLVEQQPPSATASAHPPLPDRRRRPSVISLPANTTTTAASTALLHRKEEEGEPAVPYADGPIQIMPSIWLGSEENARDWNGLMERGIKSILNVAKEVASPFDNTRPLRSTASVPNFHDPGQSDPTYYPPHPASGRPGMHYLKLQWSHGQHDLVGNGFQAAMSFTDAAVERGEGVLIHCQCGISRSATMTIALVMRAAAERSPSVPSEIWALKGMQGAYTYVKEKSKWVGPNMSLIYQLLEYERKLSGDRGSPSASERSSVADEEEEWGRRRKLLDEVPSDDDDDRQSSIVMEEAKALDKAMEDRIIARKSSTSSVASSGVGMGAAWRSRFITRKRTGSVASNMTNGSMLSEDLVEEEEEQELLGVGGGFESDRTGGSAESELSATTSPEDDGQGRRVRRPMAPLAVVNTGRTSGPPPSAPVWKTSFSIPPPPASAVRPTFGLSSVPAPKAKRRPVNLGILPAVPSSPIQIIVDTEESDDAASLNENQKVQPFVPRTRTESRKPAPPPLHLRSSVLKKANKVQAMSSVATPSQTLFVFPPSPTLTTRTPSTMTLTSNISTPVPFPSLSTPRVSTFRAEGRTRSFIGLGVPPTPTTAFSKVDVRGYVGLE